MASKVKKSAVSSSSYAVSSTPTPGTSTPLPRPTSPLSPTRHSRLQEKADLQNLNDRLACYIDRVRYLETENSRLTREIQSSVETSTRETSTLKSIYDSELQDARKLLDETAREKAKLEIDTKRLWDENDDLKARLEKKSKDLILAENSARMYESRCSELGAKYNTAISERKKLQDDCKELEKEVEKLRRLLEDLRKQLEEETLARVDLENHVQSLREELNFKDQVYQQELTETRTRRQVEISEIDGRLAEQYEAKLQQSLQDLREQYESSNKANREEIEALFENKIKNLQSSAQRIGQAANVATEELRSARSRIDSLCSRISELESSNGAANARIRELEKSLENERQRHADELRLLENDLARMREEMARQLQEYQDLMDIKVSLDLEISAYRKLLEGEESRLNITPHGSPGKSSSGRGTPLLKRLTPSRQGAKRKRTLLEESHEQSYSDFNTTSSAKGDIEIVEADPDGAYVKIINKGAKELAIGGWQLIRKVGDLETTFKFHRSVKLDGGATSTIWSADLGQTHEPPGNLVMKSQKWFTGDNMVTKLVNNAGEEVAVSERVRNQLSSRSSRHRELGYGGISEELYHQQGDPQGDERCRLM